MFSQKLPIVLGVSIVLLHVSYLLAAPRNPGGDLTNGRGPRIINGTYAHANSTAHQVSIRRRLNDGYFFGTGHICGGSLIAENIVLSAAHCFVDQVIYNGTFQNKDDFIVVMGELDRFEKTNNTLTFDIEKIVFDVESFNLSTYEQDIALLFLNGSVPANHPTVKPILLNRKTPVANGTVCQVTGWGTTEDGWLADILMTVDVPIIDNNTCANDSEFSEGMIKEGMMCAGYLDQGERDACGGDSGGPLACHQLLTGIVSWGIGCALPKLPGVYTDVAYWVPWIEQHVKAANGSLPGGSGGAMSSFKSSYTLTAVLATVMILLNKFV